MKALVKRKAEKGLWMEEVDMPKVGAEDVLIKVDRAGICGTDVHIYNWDAWAQEAVPVPLVIGHEFVGEIVEVGDNVQGLKSGVIVSGEGHIVCGSCRSCLAGRRHLCKDTRGVGVNRPGAFAEYIAIPKGNVWVQEMSISRDIQSIFDPYGNAVHTALSFDVVGEDVLITGAGPIGLMAVAICKFVGARNVVITDVNPLRLQWAEQMGATRAVDITKECVMEVQKELGMREGFDVGLEMSGNGQALSTLLKNMVHGGKIAVLGIPEKEIAIDWNIIVFKGLVIKGIYGREMYETWYKGTALLQSGLDISSVITHHFPFANYEDGFDVMCKGTAAKVILKW